MAHVIEGRVTLTLVVGTALDIMSKVHPPLNELPKFTSRDEIRDVHCQWASDGSRAWEAEVRADILRDR